jgi:hypothetical protein
VDDEGLPREDVSLLSLVGNNLAHPEVYGILPQGVAGLTPVGPDGRFRVERLVPGLRYGAGGGRGSTGLGFLFKNVTVAPGEARDLGDLKIEPFKP